MTWDSVETARCARCRIFTPVGDLVLGPDGMPYCCGIPASAYERSIEVPAPVRPSPLERTTRLVIAAMLVLTLAFPLAACCSQL